MGGREADREMKERPAQIREAREEAPHTQSIQKGAKITLATAPCLHNSSFIPPRLYSSFMRPSHLHFMPVLVPLLSVHVLLELEERAWLHARALRHLVLEASILLCNCKR